MPVRLKITADRSNICNGQTDSSCELCNYATLLLSYMVYLVKSLFEII